MLLKAENKQKNSYSKSSQRHNNKLYIKQLKYRGIVKDEYLVIILG